MNILKRFSRTYIVITILSILILSIITTMYMNNYSKAELTRISGITKTVQGEVNEALEHIYNYGSDMEEWIETSLIIKNTYGSDNVEDILNIKNKVEQKYCDYLAVVNENGIKQYMVTNTVVQEEAVDIANSGIKKLKDLNSESEGYLYATKDKLYYVYVDRIDFEKKQSGYLVILKELDEEFINFVGRFRGRKMAMVTGIDKSMKMVRNYDGKNNNFYYQTNGETITSYVQLETEGEQLEYYLSLTEPRKTVNTTKELSKNYLILFIIAFVLTNTTIYYIIKKKVVARIVNTNSEVNKIIKNDMERELLPVDGYNDEITHLTIDVNEMLQRIDNDTLRIKRQHKKNARLLESMVNGYMYISIIKNSEGEIVDGKIEDINKTAKILYKVDPDEKLVYLSEIISRVNTKMDKVIKDLNMINEIGTGIVIEEINLVDDVWVALNITCVEENKFSIILNDISNLKKSWYELENLVNTDDTTKLRSRFFLMEYLKEVSNSKEEFQLCFIDLDNFKLINDTIGHHRGDKVLQIAADSLRKLEDKNTIVSRVGGDEFVVLRKGSVDNIDEFSKKVMGCLNRKVKFNSYTYYIRGSMGVSYYPIQSNDPYTVMQYADVALYEAKYQGGNQYKIFNKEMMETFEMDSRLKQGIDNGEFEVYYQPIYSTESYKIIGAEALVRWKKGNQIIYPMKFIGVAKKSGDIIFIDEFVLKNACVFCKERIDEGDKNFNVSVNISYKYFTLDGFVQRLEGILRSVQIPPSALELEITEDEIISDYENIIIILKKIRRLGVKVALDDFGVGYSSFNYIKNLPIDVVKIDKSLIQNIEQDEKSNYIIETLIKLCTYLELEVICEGVEKKEQLDILKDLNCKMIQGFYISKPVSKDIFMEIYKNKNN